VIFKIIVPQEPVVEGKSFQVQYVLEEQHPKDEFYTPDFKSLRVVSGPYEYSGSVQSNDGVKKLKNIVFALVASRSGRITIPAAGATVSGMYIKSDNASVEVISKETANDQFRQQQFATANDEYFLRPGEDPYDKMQKNLFIKVAINKKTCYAGEPVIATYKLYSRLESKSDIVKNPGFYGFTVHDMINLDDKMLTTETVNGKSFDVHTIRKVQLFPLRSGTYTIDEMEVQNKVIFSKSSVRKKTEQQIEEGVYDHPANGGATTNTVEFENSMRTEPITIQVKPLPAITQPAEYDGATGKFSISAAVVENRMNKDEEGNLLVTITGKGNFTQLSAPTIQWPVGVEGYEAVIKDELDKNQSPLTGKRTFRFPFTVTHSGTYTLPALDFSFFDPDSNNYKTVHTKAVSVTVTDVKEEEKLSRNIVGKTANKGNTLLWVLSFAALLVGIIFVLRRKKNTSTTRPIVEEKKQVSSVHSLLLPARLLLPADNKSFYSALRGAVWAFLNQRFQVRGGGMTKRELKLVLQQSHISNEDAETLLSILGHCDTGIFTNVDSYLDKNELLQLADTTLTRIGVA
jgi:hypothetical protein